MIKRLKAELVKAIEKQGIKDPIVNLIHPEDISFGDFSSNIALIYSKELKINSKELAEKIVLELKNNLLEEIESIEIAGSGFINFRLKDSYFTKEILNLIKQGEEIGKNDLDKGKKIMIEYTDPNPFKVFHIGHLMANTIGESISRIVEFSGAEIIRACYQGDVGLHVAKTIWAILKDGNFQLNIKYLGDMYVIGNEKYENDEIAKKEIIEINKKIFEKSDENINDIYKKGRDLSLEYFDTIYKKLGTKFDNFFFESEVADDGIKIVNEFLKKQIFIESEGAIVFPGEKYGEHTRVFINSQGLPTYEAKELGLTKNKFNLYPDLAESIVITANEQNAYFKVILVVLKEIYPEIALKMKHAKKEGRMECYSGGCFACRDLEKVVQGKAKLVGVGTYNKDIFVVNE